MDQGTKRSRADYLVLHSSFGGSCLGGVNSLSYSSLVGPETICTRMTKVGSVDCIYRVVHVCITIVKKCAKTIEKNTQQGHQ